MTEENDEKIKVWTLFKNLLNHNYSLKVFLQLRVNKSTS